MTQADQKDIPDATEKNEQPPAYTIHERMRDIRHVVACHNNKDATDEQLEERERAMNRLSGLGAGELVEAFTIMAHSGLRMAMFRDREFRG